ncbi:hypothetical protein BCF33_2511 [Hasllibacter halocynthiae]|uniref:DUF465 domain-containing protein n=1 Tax=Hasllibacter halocynthiae TaxID=595589 RepID=A0A2T0X3X0_9RHOB|nr:YdcH family protein [Hasllibacter halocynthiae]PRY93630.1 hypothetical protein BCF33_2511 [Hasllibacter halocynthiae]
MTTDAHISALRKKHQSLSQQVEAAQRSPSADDLAIAQMKKQKLALKEQMVRLSG